MTLNSGNFNLGDLVDSQHLSDVFVATLNPVDRVGNWEASQMLDILQELQTNMQSMNGRIASLEQSPRYGKKDKINALSDRNPNLKDMAEEDSLYKEAAPKLFGDGFSKKAKDMMN